MIEESTGFDLFLNMLSLQLAVSSSDPYLVSLCVPDLFLFIDTHLEELFVDSHGTTIKLMDGKDTKSIISSNVVAK